MKNIFNFLLKLVGNKKTVAIAIFIFIGLFVLTGVRCAHAANLDLAVGASFDRAEYAPVLGFDAHFPQGNNLNVVGGTMLWGSTKDASNNWDWHVGIESCRWNLCAMIGAAYVQRIDAFNGTHTNYSLRLIYNLPWNRVKSMGIYHLSNAGTSPTNGGRDAAVVNFRLQ